MTGTRSVLLSLLLTTLGSVMSFSESSVISESAASRKAKVVYLDQNKWIDLAWAATAPHDHPTTRPVLEWLCDKVEADEVRLPLTAANLYETQKINNPELRFAVARTQTTLSRAEVFRGRHRRLQIEVARVLSLLYRLTWVEPEPQWVFSRLFFEAQAEMDDPRLGLAMPPQALAFIQANPQRSILDYLAASDDDLRRGAVAKFEAGCESMRIDIEARRARHGDQSLSIRRKIYGALLVLGEQDILIAVADRLGLPWRCYEDNKGATMRAVIRETPTFLIEREIVLKLEAQARAIHVNDMRDMQNFTTVLPYADIVVAENQFINLARQAGLAERFGVGLETDLNALLKLG